MYSYDEVLAASQEYFGGDDLAATVFVDKYALRDDKSNILEKMPTDMHWRLAREFARIERNKFKDPLNEAEIFSLFDRFTYIIPQGSVLYGCGNNYQIVSLSNCYVVESPQDSYGGILKTDQELVQISKRRGGVGIDLSTLRPKGSPTKNSSRHSTGVVSWMKRYSNSIREVGQDGRRGALMLTISVHHPDILDFINIKNDPTQVTGANISVRYTDEFLRAVENDEEYELRFPVDSTNVVGKIPAKQVWDAAVYSAWNRAEPGILFWDRICSYNAIDCYAQDGYLTQSTNPCSELPLCPFDSCRLMIQNLYSYVVDPFTENAKFDSHLFYQHAKIAQRLMDDLIDLELEKIETIIDKIKNDPQSYEVKSTELNLWMRIHEKCRNGRRTGLGITAEGDMLAALGIKYGSDESIWMVETVHRLQKHASYESSIQMAAELGPFPIWDWEKEKNSPFLLQIKSERPDIYAAARHYGRRNIGNLTIAPTGSMSLLTQTTSGIEPLFMLEPYKRRKKINPSDKNARIDFTDPSGDSWQEFEVMHPKLKVWMEVTGNTNWRESPWFGACAEDLDWTQRVKLQAGAQCHTDHAISSTLNLPENVSLEKVDEIFRTAWKEGLKGITVYRKNCRTGVLVEKKELVTPTFKKRPKELLCDIYHVTIKGKPHTVCVSLSEGQPYEVLVIAEKTGRNLDRGKIVKRKRGWYDLYNMEGEVLYENMTGWCANEEGNITRLISTLLRHQVRVDYIVDQLQKVSGENINGFARSISRCLKHYIPDNTLKGEKCECGGELIYSEGCIRCPSCGHSKCN